MCDLRIEQEPQARSLRIERKGDRRQLTVTLRDGQAHSVPLSFHPTLARGSASQIQNFRPIGRGVGFHWPDLDFDLSVRGLLEGRRELRVTPHARRRGG